MLYLLLAIALILVALYFLVPIVTICGDSMFPTLKDGDIYIGTKVFFKHRCKVNEIYVFRAPYKTDTEKYIVKRIAYASKSLGYYILGDNSNCSYDSRIYGWVPCKNVVAHLHLKQRRCSDNGVSNH